MAIILETSRLVLRHQVIDDLDDLWQLYCNPEITKFIPDAPRSRAEARKELEWHMHGHPHNRELGLWTTIHKESGRYIGRCGLLPWTIDLQNEVELAYTISQEFWGQGLGTEAAQALRQYGFEKLSLPRLVSLIEPGNIASIRVAEKIGLTFEKEGSDELGSFLVYSIAQE
jgi:RimJ/RimL family protein N-acetyltransferase